MADVIQSIFLKETIEMRLLRSLFLALALLVATSPLASLAADCSAIETRSAGTYSVESLFLLDSDVDAGTGTACDLSTYGDPDFVRVSVRNATGGTSYVIRVEGLDASAGLASTLGFLNSETSGSDANSSIVVQAPVPKFLRGVVVEEAGLTDLDVIVEAFFSNPSTITYSSQGVVQEVIFCGQADESGTIYLGPATAAFGGDGSDSSVGSTACDALDSATESTADAPVLTEVAFAILGAICNTNGTLGAAETVTFTLRSAEASTSPAQSCVISEAESWCSITTPTSVDVAAGATVAVRAVQSSDNADDDLWCRAVISVR